MAALNKHQIVKPKLVFLSALGRSIFSDCVAENETLKMTYGGV
jgi:hypothetical protein